MFAIYGPFDRVNRLYCKIYRQTFYTCDLTIYKDFDEYLLNNAEIHDSRLNQG